MKGDTPSVLPIAVIHPRYKQDSGFATPVSFVAGFLIGILTTYCFLYLPIFFNGAFYSSIPERTVSPVMNDVRGNVQNDTSNLSPRRPATDGRGQPFAGIKTKIFAPGHPSFESTFSLPGHPAEAEPSKPLQTITEKSGLDFSPDERSSRKTVKDFPVRPIKKPRNPPTINLLLNRSRGKSAESSSKSYRPRDIVDGVYWTPLSERFVPRGYDEYDIRLWRRLLNTTEVVKVEIGCGRMQNRLLTFAEGGKSCCRYRVNNDQIQGEIFSFYLGRLLGLRNLYPSALALVDRRKKRWSSVVRQISLAKWSPERPVVLTQFVEDLQPAYIPKHFREKGKRRLHPIKEDLHNLTTSDISELVQWSDMLVFDYLTGNLDRVVNNMFNEQWNSQMMKQPTHNLAKTPEGLLLFMDNESGLLHGYRLLEKYEHFHRDLLDSLCIFKRDTIDAVQRLHEGDVEQMLTKSFLDGDPGMFDWLPFLPDKSIRTLKERIAYVLRHFRTCKAWFTSNNFQKTLINDR